MSERVAQIAPQGVAEKRSKYGIRTLYGVAPLLVAVGMCCLWQLVVSFANVSSYTLPGPWNVAGRLGDQATYFAHPMITTLREMLFGLGFATAFGILASVLIVAFRPVRLTLYPVLVGSQVIPKVAVAPLILIWFGLTDKSRYIIVFLISFFPIVVAMVSGLESVEPAKLQLARSIGAGTFRTFVKVRIPQSLPSFFAGLKLAAALAVGAAFVSEFLSAGPGLGSVIVQASYQLRPDIALAAIGYLVFIGVGFFYIVTFTERLILPWHISVRGNRR